jgi:signal transduction histidine kinase
VEDNGPGMTEDILVRVFEPFFTTKDPGMGTGLGLSVSYMIVTQNHKGFMEVQSTPGRGTVFKVRLPIGGSQT